MNNSSARLRKCPTGLFRPRFSLLFELILLEIPKIVCFAAWQTSWLQKTYERTLPRFRRGF